MMLWIRCGCRPTYRKAALVDGRQVACVGHGDDRPGKVALGLDAAQVGDVVAAVRMLAVLGHDGHAQGRATVVTSVEDPAAAPAQPH